MPLHGQKHFSKEYFPKDYRVFGVESWLIDPDLVQILPEGNMKAYARRFHLIDTEKSDEIFPDGWRVFGAEWKKKPEECPGRPGCREQLQTICSREADWEAAMAYLSGNNNGMEAIAAEQKLWQGHF